METIFEEVGAGRYLGGEGRPVSARTLQRWRAEGTGPAWFSVGARLVRYRKSDLDAYMAAGRREPITDKAA